MTAGMSDRYLRLDDGDHFYNYTQRCIIEATVSSEMECFLTTYGGGAANISFFVDNVKMLGGNVPLIGESETVQTGNAQQEHMLWGFNQLYTERLRLGQDSLLENRAAFFHFGGHDYGSGQIMDLTIGSRYVFVLRFERFPPLSERNARHSLLTSSEMGDYYVGDYFYRIGDYLSDPWCDAIWPLDGVPDNYLELDEYKPLRDIIEITK